MNKQTVELNIPEGYEIKEKEPRAPKEGEYYFNMRRNKASECTHTWADVSGVAIILRKKKPVYTVIDHSFSIPAYDAGRFVEIKALEDAMKILENMNMNPELDMFECDAYGPLKELLK